MFNLDLEKAKRNQRSNCQQPLDNWKRKRVPQRHLLLLYWRHQSLCVVFSTNCGKFLKRWEYQTTWLASWEICKQVKKQQLEPDIEKQTVPNWERSTSRLILSPCLFNSWTAPFQAPPSMGFSRQEYWSGVLLPSLYMQSTSCKMPGWMKHKLENQ